MVEVPRTNTNRTNTVPATAAAADPAAALNGGMGGIDGLLQMLMQFIQQLFGGAGGGFGNFFSSLMGREARQQPEDGAAPADGQSPAPSPRNDFARTAGGVSIPPDGKFDSRRALDLACRDDARGGYCGRGVHNILTSQGYRVPSADGHNWDRTLPQNGWVKLEGVNARNAPEGAVLVYDSDVQRGRAPRNGRNGQGGDEFGHVEVVCYDAQGNRKYVSDAARSNFGGTVPNNFVGAYVPRERYENYLAQQRREQADTAVARNETPNNNRNTSVASAVDGPGIRAESLTASFTAADQRRQLAAGPVIAAPQPGVAPAPGMA